MFGRILSCLRALVVLALVVAACTSCAMTRVLDSAGVSQQPLPQTQAQVDSLREKLQQLLWQTPGLPSADSVKIADDNLANVPLAEDLRKLATSAQLWVVPLRFGLESRVTVLSPKATTAKKCALVFNSGHGPTPDSGAVLISKTLQAGCTLAIVELPGSGRNRGQVASLENGAKVSEADGTGLHDGISMLDDGKRTAMDLFVTPPIVVAAKLRQLGYITNMAGFSGGGWITPIAAAADPAIVDSTSVAGFLNVPDVRTCAGDYEQCAPTFFNAFSAEQMYVLASAGPGRAFYQVWNMYDSCCNAVTQLPDFVEPIQAALVSIGSGRYVPTIDTTIRDNHAIPQGVADQTVARLAS